MQGKYDLIRVGGTLGEAETVLGIPKAIFEYDDITHPETLKETTLAESLQIPFVNCYVGDNYAIVIYYDPDKDCILAKQLLLLKKWSFYRKIFGKNRSGSEWQLPSTDPDVPN